MDLIILIVLIGIILYLLCIIERHKLSVFFREFEEIKKEYITHSTIIYLKEKYAKLYRNLKNNHISSKSSTFIRIYSCLEKVCTELNEEYVKRELENNKEYFDKMFSYPIDEEQRRAIIIDDDNNLIIAGAGSGKTTTIIGKTKYLIEKKNINPDEIITISFTNAAKDNFVEKLNDSRVRCSTFHKLGKDIIEDDDFKSDIAPEDFIWKCIKNYLKYEIKKYPELCSHFIKFYSYYMYESDNNDLDFGKTIEKEKGYDLETLKNKYYRIKELMTIKEEKVKSVQELEIANFLFINGVNYIYEAPYKYNLRSKTHRQYHPDFYLPDYDIYLEHFGINKKGFAPQYNEIEERKYLDGMAFKRRVHKEYKTKLIETYSYDFDNYEIEKNLTVKLKKAGIKLNPIGLDELLDTINSVNNEEMNSFYSLISKFIKMFKGNNYEDSKFDEFIEDAKKKGNIRHFYLLELIKNIYIYYQNKLKENSYIDFDDMINLATAKVNEYYDKHVSYIIIDEFQDTSYSRYKLIKAIQNQTGAKVVAVGDDWQSIYRFSGCDLNLFVNFKEYFSYPKILYITNTYRNSQNLINIAGTFIMQNEKGQIKKELKSHKENIDSPIEYFCYNTNIELATKNAIFELRKIGCKRIAILGRNNSDIQRYNLEKDTFKKEIDLSAKFGEGVVFATVHKSKGLEYDGVIVCNMDNYITGFPNKMSDDSILDYVSLSKDDYLYEEERRLFYVALTRTKTKCMILIPIFNPSIFAKELKKLSNNGIKLNMIEDDERIHNPKCPKCNNGILVSRINSQDNTVFVGCSNYPKCDFNYSKTDIIKNTIKCPKCNAYMVKRKGPRGEFYGCINYPYCNQTIERFDNNYFINRLNN